MERLLIICGSLEGCKYLIYVMGREEIQEFRLDVNLRCWIWKNSREQKDFKNLKYSTLYQREIPINIMAFPL